MDERTNSMHNATPALIAQEHLLGQTTQQIYKAIDANSNIFDADYRDETVTYIGTEFGDRLYMIEKFGEEIQKGRKGFSNKLTEQGHMKPLALAKYLKMMNSFLSLHSFSKIYSPQVELFFDILVIKYGLIPGDFKDSPNVYSSLFKMKQGEFFNKLIEEILGVLKDQVQHLLL